MGEIKLTERELAHLEILKHIGATKDRPAFWEDYGELSRMVIAKLRRIGLVDRATLVRRGGAWGERRATGYWITPAGLSALEGGS